MFSLEANYKDGSKQRSAFLLVLGDPETQKHVVFCPKQDLVGSARGQSARLKDEVCNI